MFHTDVIVYCLPSSPLVSHSDQHILMHDDDDDDDDDEGFYSVVQSTEGRLLSC